MKVTEDIADGFYPNISGDDYHAGPGISSSQIKTMIKRSPRHYWGAYVQPDPNGEKQSAAKDFGKAYHKAVLEPDTFFTEFVVPPKKWNLNRKADRAERDAFLANNPEKVLVTQEQLDQVKRMRDALLADSDIETLIAGAVCEASGFWRDPDTGLLLKYRPDGWKPKFIFDIKTCTDCSPSAFARDLHKFGYDNSAAHYLDGDRIVNGTDHETFVLIAQEKDYPFAAAAYPVGDLSLELARAENRHALNTIAYCQANDAWPSYTAQDLDRPYYARRKATDFED